MRMFLRIFTVFSLLFLANCGYRNFDANLNLKLKSKESIVGEHIGVNVVVDDSRVNKKYVGEKQVSSNKKIYIGLKTDLEKEVKNKFTKALLKRGFDEGEDRLIGVHITKLSYEVKSGFIMSDSSIIVEVQVAVKDKKSKKITIKKYGINSSRSHLLLPSEQSDEKIINKALQEVINDILKDDDFLFSLIR